MEDEARLAALHVELEPREPASPRAAEKDDRENGEKCKREKNDDDYHILLLIIVKNVLYFHTFVKWQYDEEHARHLRRWLLFFCAFFLPGYAAQGLRRAGAPPPPSSCSRR